MSMTKACTRPFRAAYVAFLTPGIFLVGLLAIGFLAWIVIDMLIDLHKTWTSTVCTFTEPMTVERVSKGKYSSDGWRVVAPVTVGPKAWTAIAHRWPSRQMTDTSRAALFNWWLGIGGTGKVLEPPTEGWFGSRGKFEFTTPVGKRVACFYLPGPDGVPENVKLSNEVVNPIALWIGAVLLGLMALVLLALTLYFAAASLEECTDKWEELEDEDEAAEHRAKMSRMQLRRISSKAGQLVGARAIHRSNSHFFAQESEWYAGGGHDDASIRNGFLRKVYGILTFQVHQHPSPSLYTPYLPASILPHLTVTSPSPYLSGPTHRHRRVPIHVL